MTKETEYANPESPSQHRIKDAALAILDQGEQLVSFLPVAAYRERTPLAFNASIGGHYRHCLDHFASFLRGLDRGEINYDARDRDPRLESDPEFARQLTGRLRREIEALTQETLARPIATRAEVSYAPGESAVAASSAGRELAYAIAHAIHHYALIAFMARLNGVALPEGFGLAPSTLAYQTRQTVQASHHNHVALAI